MEIQLLGKLHNMEPAHIHYKMNSYLRSIGGGYVVKQALSDA